MGQSTPKSLARSGSDARPVVLLRSGSDARPLAASGAG